MGFEHVGPLGFKPREMAFNFAHACPELARQELGTMLDCCCQDMWGAGCFLHEVFTHLTPWTLPASGHSVPHWPALTVLHEGWVSSGLPASFHPHATIRCQYPYF